MIVFNEPIHIRYFMKKISFDLSRQALIKQETTTELEACLGCTTKAAALSNNIQQRGGHDVKN